VNQKDYYHVLGVSKDADKLTIRDAYRKLAFKYHPDRNKGDAASAEKMKEINEAYAVLSDDGKRTTYDSLHQQYGSGAYDHFRHDYSEQDIFRGSDIGQVFEEMAKAFGFRGFEDVFKEAYGRTYQTREFRGPNLFGRVIVFGPRGKNDNSVSVGAEKPSLLGKAIGKAVQYAAKKVMARLGGVQDVVYDTITLDEHEATHGAKIAYADQKHARQLNISIPPGVKEGQLIRLRDVDGARGAQNDLYLKIEIRKPLLKKVKELLKV
jgi:DnaJ-class molecular chaperone